MTVSLTVDCDAELELRGGCDPHLDMVSGILVSGGVTDYNDLENKPQINGVDLVGNRSLPDLDINRITNSFINSLF
jgi:hypothetical protein